MFGNNERLKPVTNGDGSVLRVVARSPFFTIQGEGPFAGMPAAFIRLHGCHLACYFCDTKFDDPNDPGITPAAIARMARDASGDCTLAVITGGEPTRQPLGLLVNALWEVGFSTVQIETAGSFWQECFSLPFVHLVVSPKTTFVHPDVANHARAWKYIIRSGEIDLEDGLPNSSTQKAGEPKRLFRASNGAPVYLSPCDEYNDEANARNARLVAELAMRYGYRAGVQMHKIFRIE